MARKPSLLDVKVVMKKVAFLFLAPLGQIATVFLSLMASGTGGNAILKKMVAVVHYISMTDFGDFVKVRKALPPLDGTIRKSHLTTIWTLKHHRSAGGLVIGSAAKLR